MARSDFSPGLNPTLNGPHVVAVLAGEAADELAAAIVPVISVAESVDAVAAALAARADYADVDFIVAQFVGTIMVARLRGSRFELTVTRKDGVEARFAAPRARSVVDIREDSCAAVEIRDIDAASDRTAAIPLPLGWEASSAVIYQSDAVLSDSEEQQWREHSTSTGRFQPPPVRGLEFSDGRRLIVDRTVLIGRSPRVEDAEAPDRPVVFTVNSPKRDISRTHLRISTDGSQVLLEDLNSTNGTEVTPRGGLPFLLEPGEPALLEDGMVVSIGDHVAFTVVTVE